MRFLFILMKKDKARVFAMADTLDLLAMLTMVCKNVGEKIQKEKGMGYEKAMKFVIECIEQSHNLIR